jgi:hypothetical protein
VLLKIRISSKNTSTNLRMTGLRMSFIRDWNVDGALVRPKGITRNSIVSLVCPERRLVDVVRVHTHLMIAAMKVQPGEVAGVSQFV